MIKKGNPISVFPEFTPKKMTFPKWYWLFLWILPTKTYSIGNDYIEAKFFGGKCYIVGEGKVNWI